MKIKTPELPNCVDYITTICDVNGITITRGSSTMKDYKLPKKYIINEKATILIWKDNSKTVIKKSDDDIYDKRIAFLTAYFQKNCGLSKNKANKYLKELIDEKEMMEAKAVKESKKDDEINFWE